MFNSSNQPNTWYDYTPYSTIWCSTQKKEVSYKFTGQERDNEIGLNNFRARMYDDTLNVFYAVDPSWQKYPMQSPYSYVFGNPVMMIDPTGRDTVCFDEKGHEIGRIASEKGNATYYRVNDSRKGAVLSKLKDVAGSFAEAKMPGVIKGYEDKKYQKLDYQIAASTSIMNDKLVSKDGLPATKNHQFTDESKTQTLDVNLVKSIIMQESAMGALKGNGTGMSDPMQSNYPGDYDETLKSAVGLIKNQTMNPETSINAGLGIFVIKGMNSDEAGNYTTWKGDQTAVSKYNGGDAKNYQQNVYKYYDSIAAR